MSRFTSQFTALIGAIALSVVSLHAIVTLPAPSDSPVLVTTSQIA